MKCHFCLTNGHEDGHDITAIKAMPQSDDHGKTVKMFACCASHVAGWWDNADWDGRHLEVPLDNEPNTVIFHDRGVGKEFRHFIDGKILLRENADNEMLYSELCAGVEQQIAGGRFSGMTTDPCHPEWTLACVSGASPVAANEDTAWTGWYTNPFKAIAQAANANGTPEDLEKTRVSLYEIFTWDTVAPGSLMDDLLQEIAGATNIVVQYDRNGLYRAAYDK
jgi:hypothetical protein